MMPIVNNCPFCGLDYNMHVGIVGMCQQVQNLRNALKQITVLSVDTNVLSIALSALRDYNNGYSVIYSTSTATNTNVNSGLHSIQVLVPPDVFYCPTSNDFLNRSTCESMGDGFRDYWIIATKYFPRRWKIYDGNNNLIAESCAMTEDEALALFIEVLKPPQELLDVVRISDDCKPNARVFVC